ncbi:MAG: ABC transporter ATP-binding protein [Pyrinomonadaceae bacterium]
MLEDKTRERLGRDLSPATTQPEQRDCAISISHLSKTYPVPFARLKAFLRRKVKPATEALRDVSFAVRRGEIFGLIGRNGAGKTTLTKIVATLVQPTVGTVSVNGFDSVRDDEKVRTQVGLSGAEERSFYWRLTLDENLMFFARLYGMKDRVARQRINELFAQLELEENARKRFGELSTGNKQRLAVARALLPSPPVMLLDEPTRSLDPLAASRMREMIRSLAHQEQPVTILFTSHNLAEVETLCDRVAIISSGQIRAIDSPKNLRSLSSDSEVVRLTIVGLTRDHIEGVLAARINQVQYEPRLDKLQISFTRRAVDDTLDFVVREIHRLGGKILDVESERPSLLDVLESYERGQ